jgi:integrase/recombinase XerD
MNYQSNLEMILSTWVMGKSDITQMQHPIYIRHADRRSEQLFKKPLIKLSYPEIAKLMQELGKTNSKRSQCTLTHIIRSFFKTVQKMHIRKDNPTEELRPPKYRDDLAKRIVPFEVIAAVIRATENVEDRLAFRLMYQSGLRVGDIVQLKVGDLTTRPIKDETAYFLTLWGKGQHEDTNRLIPDLGKELMEFVKGKDSTELMFSYAAKGQKYTTSTNKIRIRLHKVCQKANIRPITPHFFRHAHASQMLDGGANIKSVQRSLRHRSLQSTEKYLHVRPDEIPADFLPDLKL